jgi:hypothetical protein
LQPNGSLEALESFGFEFVERTVPLDATLDLHDLVWFQRGRSRSTLTLDLLDPTLQPFQDLEALFLERRRDDHLRYHELLLRRSCMSCSCCSCAAARYVVAHGSRWRRRGPSAGVEYMVVDESSDQRILRARCRVDHLGGVISG